ncbi:MAG: O-methyltransferase [Bacteroidales bacterium]
MMNSDLERYIEAHCSPEDALLTELDRETHLRVIHARMLSGNEQGQLLTMLMQMIRPKIAVEIGTFTGYSAICLAKGMSEDALLHTIEINDELESIAASFFAKANLTRQIKAYIGDALEVIPQIEGMIDFVFIDGNKRHYCAYYNAVFPKLSVGAFMLADNILWDGKVVQEIDPKDQQTQGIIEFNQMVAADERVSQVILPIRDGLSLIRKNKP